MVSPNSVPLNDALNKTVEFDNKRADVVLRQVDGGLLSISYVLTTEEAYTLMQILENRLYLHEEVRIRRD